MVTMASFITKKQYDEIANASFCFGRNEFNELLEKYTGVEARPYTAYQYYDVAGNYIGDSNEDDLDNLLRAAYVEVKDG